MDQEKYLCTELDFIAVILSVNMKITIPRNFVEYNVVIYVYYITCFFPLFNAPICLFIISTENFFVGDYSDITSNNDSG